MQLWCRVPLPPIVTQPFSGPSSKATPVLQTLLRCPLPWMLSSVTLELPAPLDFSSQLFARWEHRPLILLEQCLAEFILGAPLLEGGWLAALAWGLLEYQPFQKATAVFGVAYTPACLWSCSHSWGLM